MRYLIVHAHHEPKSFNGALTRVGAEALARAGHEVEVSDLYASGFDPVSDRRNFTTVADPDYLKQQAEESHATANDGFEPGLLAEIEKLERCDALVFQFPLWWFGMPAILKGWCDRVMAMGRIYGEGKWYENGIGAGKRAIVSMTTGGPPEMYAGAGLNPPMDELLAPINHGVFWFNGFTPVEPFITWAPARMSDEDRAARLAEYAELLPRLHERPTVPCLPSTAFDPKAGFSDRWKRFVVAWRLRDGATPGDDQVADERRALDALRHEGVLVGGWIGADRRRGGMTLRAESEAGARAALDALPLAGLLEFDVAEMDVTSTR